MIIGANVEVIEIDVFKWVDVFDMLFKFIFCLCPFIVVTSFNCVMEDEFFGCRDVFRGLFQVREVN